MLKNIKEKKIKVRLIDFLLNKYYKQNILIGVEVPYLSGKRWVDVLLIKNKSLIAFEIKSDADDLRRLIKQLKDYELTFKQLYLVISKKFINTNLISKINKSIGIILIDENSQLKIKRKAKINHCLNKQNLSRFLWKQDMMRIINVHNLPISGLRNKFLHKYTSSEIYKYALLVLNKRYSNRFKLFLKERGKYTHIEDLNILTKKLVALF